MISPLQPGALLLHKYRIECVHRDRSGVVLCRGTDMLHARRVSVKVLERMDADASERFHLAARGSNVIDIGIADGLPYVVATEQGDTLPHGPPAKRTTSSVPPPLPARARRSQPPADIPIYVDEAALPAAPLSQPELVFACTNSDPVRRSSLWAWAAALAVVGLTGAGGWCIGHLTSPSALAAAPESITIQADPMPNPASPSVDERPIIDEPAPTQTVAPTTSVTPTPRMPPSAASASSDPLTL